jgi:hypothetical protein
LHKHYCVVKNNGAKVKNSFETTKKQLQLGAKLPHRATVMPFIKYRIRLDAEPAGLNMNNPQ